MISYRFTFQKSTFIYTYVFGLTLFSADEEEAPSKLSAPSYSFLHLQLLMWVRARRRNYE